MLKIGGGDGDRTHDPFHAMEVLSQLSYAPNSNLDPGLKPRDAILSKTPKKTSQSVEDKQKAWPRGQARKTAVEAEPYPQVGGRNRIRTCDPLRVKQVL